MVEPQADFSTQPTPAPVSRCQVQEQEDEVAQDVRQGNLVRTARDSVESHRWFVDEAKSGEHQLSIVEQVNTVDGQNPAPVDR